MKIFVFTMLAMLCSIAQAYKECDEKIKSLYVGDNGTFWITFLDGGAANMRDTDVDFKNTLSALLAAKMADKEIKMRYTSDNATCSELRTDISGVWIK